MGNAQADIGRVEATQRPISVELMDNSTDLENTPAEIGRVGVSEIDRVVNSTDLENT